MDLFYYKHSVELRSAPHEKNCENKVQTPRNHGSFVMYHHKDYTLQESMCFHVNFTSFQSVRFILFRVSHEMKKYNVMLLTLSFCLKFQDARTVQNMLVPSLLEFNYIPVI